MTKSVLLTLCATLAAISHASAASLGTLIEFNTNSAPKGKTARGGLVFGPDGVLFGTTETGGALSPGIGTIYKIDISGTPALSSVFEFTGSADGSKPQGGLVLAGDGNYYGTTSAGGADGLGTVFQMTPAGTVTIVYTFTNLSKTNTGATPTGDLVVGKDGYLYGTTSASGFNGYGTIFKLLPGTGNTPIRLADFTGDGGVKRGSKPSPLVLGSDGFFYGVTETGGLFGDGTVFRITAGGTFTTLADFGGTTGTYVGPIAPRAALIQAKNGTFYGTSAGGGVDGQGTVFSVTTAGVFKALVSFTGITGSALGGTPEAPLLQATDGFLYGTTRLGGTSGRGTVFRMSTTGALTTLISFTGGTPVLGAEPRSGLLQDNEGHLFGTTTTGGTNNAGTVFQIDNALPAKALVATDGVTALFSTRATVSGTINPKGTTALYYFEYGLTTNYGSRAPATPASAGAGNTAVSVTASISGLTPSMPYNYRLVVSNGGGTSTGSNQVFITGPNPNIVTPPSDQLVGIGDASSFQVDAIGSVLKYAWLKNGGSSSVGGASTFTISSTQLSHAGSYAVRVSDGGDSVLTPAARLGVISAANTTPLVNEGSEITLTLPSAGPGLTFQWLKDGTPISNDGRVTGAQTTALHITNAGAGDTATYVCMVTLGSLPAKASGNFVLTTKLRPVMNVPTLGPWTTNGLAFGSVSAQNSDSTTTYAAVGQLMNEGGVVINAKTGVLGGRPKAPGVYNIQFTAKNSAGTSAPLNHFITVLAPDANESGAYAGIVNRDPTSNANLGGGVTFNLTSTGTGTGKATHLGKIFSFNTALSSAPGSTRSIAITPISGQSGFPPIVATLDQATGDITGTVNTVNFTAKRNPWTTLSPVPLAQAGRFNLALSVESVHVNDAAYPQGCGVGSCTVNATGTVAWSVKLADGVSTTSTTLLTSSGTIPAHHALYATATGSAQGWLSISNTGALTETAFDWLKLDSTANGSSRSYKHGFLLHNLEADGGVYVKPVGVNVLGLAGSTDNAKFVYTDGGLPSTITQIASLPSTNVLTISTPNTNTVKMSSFDLNTGSFKGTFVVPGVSVSTNRTVTFEGVLIPRLGQGLGQFQMPGLTPTISSSDTLSGQVKLSANP